MIARHTSSIDKSSTMRSIGTCSSPPRSTNTSTRPFSNPANEFNSCVHVFSSPFRPHTAGRMRRWERFSEIWGPSKAVVGIAFIAVCCRVGDPVFMRTVAGITKRNARQHSRTCPRPTFAPLFLEVTLCGEDLWKGSG